VTTSVLFDSRLDVLESNVQENTLWIRHRLTVDFPSRPDFTRLEIAITFASRLLQLKMAAGLACCQLLWRFERSSSVPTKDVWRNRVDCPRNSFRQVRRLRALQAY
jgi:hypothetical protein